jgi:hypothetical protein
MILAFDSWHIAITLLFSRLISITISIFITVRSFSFRYYFRQAE